jgi:hypothetical protein
VLTDREGRQTGRPRQADHPKPVVGARCEVDDDTVDGRQRDLEPFDIADRDGIGARAADETRQTRRPDEIVRDDRDVGGQSTALAR